MKTVGKHPGKLGIKAKAAFIVIAYSHVVFTISRWIVMYFGDSTGDWTKTAALMSLVILVLGFTLGKLPRWAYGFAATESMDTYQQSIEKLKSLPTTNDHLALYEAKKLQDHVIVSYLIVIISPIISFVIDVVAVVNLNWMILVLSSCFSLAVMMWYFSILNKMRASLGQLETVVN